MFIPVVAVTLALLVGALDPSPTSPVADEPARQHATVTLIAEHQQFVPGSTAYLGLHFKIDPHWHTYWLGTPTAEGQLKLTLNLPAGMTLGPIQWPAPKRLISEGDLLDHVYENEVTLILPVNVPPSAQPGAAAITGSAEYLICNSSCVFENAALSLSLPIAATHTPAESPSAALFRATRARLPKSLPTAADAPTVSHTPASIIFEARGATGLSFFPAADCLLLADLLTQAHADKPRLALTPEAGADPSAPLRGVLEVRYPDARGVRWFTIEPSTTTPAAPLSSKPSSSTSPKSPN